MNVNWGEENALEGDVSSEVRSVGYDTISVLVEDHDGYQDWCGW